MVGKVECRLQHVRRGGKAGLIVGGQGSEKGGFVVLVCQSQEIQLQNMDLFFTMELEKFSSW